MAYDFYAPTNYKAEPNEIIKIWTDVKAYMQDNECLIINVRSSMGGKWMLANTQGWIDSNYYESDNEGHIFIKITNNTLEGKPIELRRGDAFAQGIFNKYYLARENKVHTKRNDGFGSTNV